MHPTTQLTDQTEAALAALDEHTHWYHTIDLAPGVVTPGIADLRPWALRILPSDLSSRRVLEIGTFDGFWAFELEKRGAEVVTVDLPAPTEAAFPPHDRRALLQEAEDNIDTFGRGFRIAHDVLRSSVTQVRVDARRLTPELVGGPFDMAFVGTVLQHVPDPTTLLESVRECVRPGGTIVAMETIDFARTLLCPRQPLGKFEPGHAGSRYTWWVPNLACLRWWGQSVGLRPRRWSRQLHFPGGRGSGMHPLTTVTFDRP